MIRHITHDENSSIPIGKRPLIAIMAVCAWMLILLVLDLIIAVIT
jgi:hypothetical protein